MVSILNVHTHTENYPTTYFTIKIIKVRSYLEYINLNIYIINHKGVVSYGNMQEKPSNTSPQGVIRPIKPKS